MAEEGDPLWPREAPAAQEEHHPPGSSCCKGFFRLWRAQHTLPKEGERRHCQPGPFALGICRPGGGRLCQEHQGLFLTAQIWYQLSVVPWQCLYWLRSLKKTRGRNCLLPERSVCSAEVKQCKEAASREFSPGNYQYGPESYVYLSPIVQMIWKCSSPCSYSSSNHCDTSSSQQKTLKSAIKAKPFTSFVQKRMCFPPETTQIYLGLQNKCSCPNQTIVHQGAYDPSTSCPE